MWGYEHKIAKIQAQNSSANFASAKLEILYSGNFLETNMMENSWKLYAGKRFGNNMWDIFWGLYTGKFCNPYQGNLIVFSTALT